MPKKSEILECKVKPAKKSRRLTYEEYVSPDEYEDNAIEIEDKETGAFYEVEKLRHDGRSSSSINKNNLIIFK